MKTFIFMLLLVFLIGCESSNPTSTTTQADKSDCYKILADSSYYEAKVESFMFNKDFLFVNRTDSLQLIIPITELHFIFKDSSVCR